MIIARPFNRILFVAVSFSIDKIPKVTSPVLVIHGTEDEVIDFSHGLAIYEKCPRPVEPLWVEVSLIFALDLARWVRKFYEKISLFKGL